MQQFLSAITPAAPNAMWLLAAALVAIYIASRVAGSAGEAMSPAGKATGRAIGHWMPVAAVALWAMILGHGAMALGVILSSSIAVVALVGGVELLAGGEPSPAAQTPTAGRRRFVLPAILMVFMGGYAGHLDWEVAVALAIVGLLVVGLRRSSESPAADAATPPPGDACGRRCLRCGGEFALAIALACIGAWAMVQGMAAVIARAGMRGAHVTEALFAVTVASPILVLPIIGASLAGTHDSQDDHAPSVEASDPSKPATHASGWGGAIQVGSIVTLLNLCALLPAVVGVWYAVQWLERKGWLSMAAGEATAAHAKGHGVTFPLGLWRIDTVLLIVLGLMLFQTAPSRPTTGALPAPSRSRGLGAALLVGYGLYILWTAVSAVSLG